MACVLAFSVNVNTMRIEHGAARTSCRILLDFVDGLNRQQCTWLTHLLQYMLDAELSKATRTSITALYTILQREQLSQELINSTLNLIQEEYTI